MLRVEQMPFIDKERMDSVEIRRRCEDDKATLIASLSKASHKQPDGKMALPSLIDITKGRMEKHDRVSHQTPGDTLCLSSMSLAQTRTSMMKFTHPQCKGSPNLLVVYKSRLRPR
jgi:hypothetical protein